MTLVLTRDKKQAMYDYTTGYDTEPDIVINNNASDWMINEGLRYYKLFRANTPTGLCGLAVFRGMPGNGKDLIKNKVSWINKEVFPNKKTLLDERPRELYGDYNWFNEESESPLFNPVTLKGDLDKMNELVAGKKMTLKERGAILDKAADDWVAEKGEVMLKNSQLCLTEFYKYVPKRDPHLAMNKTMGSLLRVKRHLDLLILGTIQIITDLDRFTCLPFIDWIVKCRRSQTNPTGYIGMVYKTEYQGEHRGIITSPVPIDIIRVDGAKPVKELGEPITIINDYKPINVRYQKLWDGLREGIDNLEDLQKEVKLRGKKPTVLSMIKRLYLNKIITYGCWFKIYNSKSATSI